MNGWNTVKLGEVATVQTGPFGSLLHESDYVKDGTPIITVENLIEGKIQFTPTTPLVATSDVERLSKYVLKEGDVVFSRVGAVDRSAYCTKEADGWMFSGRILRVRPKRELDPKFLNYYLSLESVKNRIRNLAVGGTMASLNTAILNALPIVHPPLDSQHRIVNILETWDFYLNELDKAIEYKQAVFRGLAQQLLTGERRLHGYNQKWSDYRLPDLFEFISTFSHSKDQMTYTPNGSSPVYNIHYGDIHTKYSGYIDLRYQKIPALIEDAQSISESKLLRVGDIVVADASEDYAGVGECVEILNLAGEKCIAGLHTFALRSKNKAVAPGYGSLIFKNVKVHTQMMRLATYSKVYGITKASLASVTISLPPYDEQVAIAAILNCSKNEIELLINRRQAIRYQKKFLLNRLMSGGLRQSSSFEKPSKETTYA